MKRTATWLLVLGALGCGSRERAVAPVGDAAGSGQSAAPAVAAPNPSPRVGDIAADGGRPAAAPAPPPSPAGSIALPMAGAPAADAPAPADPGIPPEVAQHASDWPLPNVDYDNTRNAKTRIASSNIAQLRESWRFALADSNAFGYVTCNPLVLGQSIYIQDMLSNVFALERGTGKVLWQRRYDKSSFGPNGAAIGWGKLFVSVGDSAIVALDLQSGADVWSFAPELGRSEGVDIQPLVYGGRVYAATVPVSEARGVYEGGTRGLLLQLDAETGQQRWAFDTVDSEDSWGDPAANGGGGAWYPPLIVPELGLSYWGTGNPVPWPGTADKLHGASRPGPNLYTSSLVAVHIEDGTLAFYHQDQPHDIFDWDFQNTPLLARANDQSGADIVVGSGKTGAVVGLDARSGELLWRTKVGKHMNDDLQAFPQQSITIFPGVLGGVMSALAYADGVVFAASNDLSMSYDGGGLLVPSLGEGSGNLTAIDVSDGKVRWTAPLEGSGYGAATIANDLVLTSDDRGTVYAFARDSGAEVWRYAAPGGINAPLVVAGDDLLISVGIGRGAVLALSLSAQGTPATSTPLPSAGAPAPATPGEPTFSAVYRDVLQAGGCNGGPTCHGSNVAGQLKMSTPSEAYTALVGAAGSCSAAGLLRVAPGEPEQSLLVHKVEDAMPACGARMPPGGMLRPEQLQQLRAWISAGAKND